jgi:hypothetical protein
MIASAMPITIGSLVEQSFFGVFCANDSDRQGQLARATRAGRIGSRKGEPIFHAGPYRCASKLQALRWGAMSNNGVPKFCGFDPAYTGSSKACHPQSLRAPTESDSIRYLVELAYGLLAKVTKKREPHLLGKTRRMYSPQ